MEFTVVTYGAGDILATTFNAIAALINSKTGTLYQPLVRFGLIIGLLWATASMVYGDKAKFIHNWLIPFYLALSLFFAPTCKIHIEDPTTQGHFTVENVPWGLGMVAGTISQIGDKVTREIEKTFSLPDDLKYHKTGAVMASNLIASARTFQITNTDIAETLRSFMNQCVVYDALMGRKYTFNDLKNASDIWQLVTERPSPARCFTYKEPGKGQIPEILTCQQGALRLDRLLKHDVRNAFQLFESKIFGGSSDTRSSSLGGVQLKRFLPGAFNYMTGMAKGAEEQMLQQMMIHAVVDGIETKSTSLGNAPNFAVQRAYLQQRANQETLAGIAAQKLIAMKNVMEALIYASFIFILPMALLPLGWSFISRWVGLVMWVQLWPPLYAILNFIMNVSLRSKGIGLIANSGGITLANSVGFMNLHADMAAQAGFMSIAIGALAYALVKGGAASFVHLASHLAGPATAAASQASESLVSGNYSFGNVSSGTVQASNTTFGQQNLSPSHNSGAFTQTDGNVSRTTTSDEGHVVSISNSSLRSHLQLSESLSQNYTEQSADAQQTAENKLIAATESQAEHNRSLLDLSEHQARQTSSGETHSTGTTASTNQSFQTLDNLVDRFAKDHSISKEKATQTLAQVSASVETGVGFNFLGLAGVSAKAGVSTHAQTTGSTADRELLSAAQDYTKQESFQTALSQASQAAHDLRHTEISDKGKRYVSSMNASSEKSQQYREEASTNLQKSQSFSKMASWTQQNAGSINANLNQEYVNWLQTQSLPHSKGAMGITEAETILSARPELNTSYQQRFLEQKMQQLERQQFGSYELPHCEKEVRQKFEDAKVRIEAPKKDRLLSQISKQAQQQGLGEVFKMDAKPPVEKHQILMDDQMMEQHDLLQQQISKREKEVTQRTGKLETDGS